MRQAGLPLTAHKTLPTTQLIHGDCLEVMPTLPSHSVQMCFADLPYGLLAAHQWDVKIPMMNFWKCIQHVGKRNAATVLTASMLFAASCVMSNAKAFKYDLVWQKIRPSNFVQAGKRPLCYHEHILLFAEQTPIFNEQRLDESERRYVESRSRLQKASYDNPFYKQQFPMMQRNSQGPMRSKSIIGNMHRKKEEGFLHPTQKPVALLEWLVRTYTQPGDTVIDPVMGSGSTAIACLNTGRHFVGIEKDSTYFAAAKNRIDSHRIALTEKEGKGPADA